MTTASAPGKIILFGEHAVVYGRPAIAVPVAQVRAEATVIPSRDTVRILAPDIGRELELTTAPVDNALASIVRFTCERLQVKAAGFTVEVHSTIPVARGLGSGAAVSVAIARALTSFFGQELSAEDISGLAYRVEVLHHGTPSGVDNTVIAYAQPIYFVRGRPFEPFQARRPFLIAIADTGVNSPTRIAVGDVRRAHDAEPERFDELFDQIGETADAARQAIVEGDIEKLGPLMSRNQVLAQMIGVSSPEIEALVNAAAEAGASGAKLSGAGRGGNVIALVNDESRERVEGAMRKAGAKRVLVTRVE